VVAQEPRRDAYRTNIENEQTSLRVGESETLSAELLAENEILLLQILDHSLLVSAQPSGDQNAKNCNSNGVIEKR